jgi:hypothetical protein
VLGVRRFQAGLWCLPDGQGYPDTEEVEGAALVRGGFGEGRDDGLAVAQVVAGQGVEVVDDVAEAADGLFARTSLAGGFGGRGVSGGRGRRGWPVRAGARR